MSSDLERELPLVARESGFHETWFVQDVDGELVAHHGDHVTRGEEARAWLAFDEATPRTNVQPTSPDELPESVVQVATDGGEPDARE